ncbi:hypothetical protein T4D_8022, partial [Trichinella pseudospiralis]
LEIKYTVIFLFFTSFYVKFFWFSRTYQQLIQSSMIYGSTVMSPSVREIIAGRLISESCICGFQARLVWKPTLTPGDAQGVALGHKKFTYANFYIT